KALWAGSSKDAKRKKERMAVRRRLRVLTLAPRLVSRSARNALMKGASRSLSSRDDGALRSLFCANVNSSRNVSLYDVNRVGAHIALMHQPLGEVALDERGYVAAPLHGLTSHRRSRRRTACCIKSGHAERYQ